MKTRIGVLLFGGFLTLGWNALPQSSFIPGGLESVGLTHVLPDVLHWYHVSNYVTNGPALPPEGTVSSQVPNLGNWEPYVSVLGDSVFLIEANTFADDGRHTNQQYGLVFQPVAGGAARMGHVFFEDAGVPYANQINLSRQNGDPGRVAGDKRYGGRNFIGGGEVSLYGFQGFFSWDGRFDTTWPLYRTLANQGAGGRDACVQCYALDPSTLEQTMLCPALDSAFARCCLDQNAISDQLSRFGGELAALDNGNFVSVVEDRSKLKNPSGNAAVATILRPDGSIVKEAFLVANGDLWSNLAAFRGGFCVRVASVLYFFDNAGELMGSSPQSGSGLAFDTGRGDGTRIASDIRSSYVYLAGRTPEAATSPVSLAVWDVRSQAFVTSTVVSETDPAVHTMDRVNLAVDALDRVCVTYAMSPDKRFFTKLQIAARVLQFDGTSFTPLTPSFFPFVNYENDTNAVRNILTSNPSVAMTTEYICIAGKGSLNSTNNPAAGPDTALETTLYAIIPHPEPVAPPPPPMMVARSGNNVLISWPAAAGFFTLQGTTTLAPTAWSGVDPQPELVPVGDTYQMTVPLAGGQLFFRLAR